MKDLSEHPDTRYLFQKNEELSEPFIMKPKSGADRIHAKNNPN